MILPNAVNIIDDASSNKIERKSVKVILQARDFWSDGREMTYHGMPITIFTSKGRLKGSVGDYGGYVDTKFDNVPCNEEIRVQIPDPSYDDPEIIPTIYKRFISCSKPTVNLGKLKIKRIYPR